MNTSKEVLSALYEIIKYNDGPQLQNNEAIALLSVVGFNFPKISSPDEMRNLPAGTYLFDKDFNLLVATDNGDPDNEEEIFETRSPLHLLFVP